jgi:hypothetical protein
MAKIISMRMQARPPTERPDRCETCRYWEKYDTDLQPAPNSQDLGSCHRFPPRFIADLDFVHSIDDTTGSATGFFPETMAWEWCGEWVLGIS